MEIVEYHPRSDQSVHTFGGSAPVMTVQPGTALKLWSEDAFNNASTSVNDVSGEEADLDVVNPRTGQHVDTERQTVGFRSRRGDSGVALPLEPMLGIIGVAPAGGEVRSSLVPERFGGYLDAPDVKTGTTVYLGVNVEGALFSIGDGHCRQGEGEACGTAVEGAMHSTVIVELIKGGAPAWPRLETDYHWMAVGSSRPMEDSWRIGQVEMVRWFGDLFGLHHLDAYQLLTRTALAPITHAVDANYGVVVKAPKALFPSAGAYGGLHAHLRREAASLH